MVSVTTHWSSAASRGRRAPARRIQEAEAHVRRHVHLGHRASFTAAAAAAAFVVEVTHDAHRLERPADQAPHRLRQ